MTEREPVSDGDRRARAMEAAREIVTLLKMAEDQGFDASDHVGSLVRERTRDFREPRQFWPLIEVLALGVAGTFDSLADWSEHVVAALAEGQGNGGER